MNVKKALKIAGICGGIYALTDLSFQLGKGYILGIMEENETANDVLELFDAYDEHLSIAKRINGKIIYFTSKILKLEEP